MLLGSFLSRTLLLMGLTQDTDASEVRVRLLQMGHKCNVYLATAVLPADIQTQFVLIQSKGSNRLNQEVHNDYLNLQKLSEALKRKQIPSFVPQPYALGEHHGVPAFSFEYLPHHVEINPHIPDVHIDDKEGRPYIPLMGNSYSGSEEAIAFNNRLFSFMDDILGYVSPSCQISSSVLKRSTFYKTSERLKAELIARLFVVCNLMGKLPKEFSTKAGDFMANFDPGVADFDPYLITIRGGWKSVPIQDFRAWIADYKESVKYDDPVEHLMNGWWTIHIFEDPQTIEDGIQRGEELLHRRRLSS